jgi:hypothetical protein
MKRIVMFNLLLAATAGFAQGQHVDIRPYVQNNQIATDGYDDATSDIVPNLRVFGYDFQEDVLDPYFASDPGFNAAAGSGLPGGSQLRFNILDAAAFGLSGNLSYWNGNDADSIAPGIQVAFATVPSGETLTLSLASSTVAVGSGTGEQAGFNIQNVTASGSVHRHLSSVLNGSGGNPADGIYLIPFELTSSLVSIADSKPLFLVYNNGNTEEMHDLAITWVEENLVPIPEPESCVLMLLGAGVYVARQHLRRRAR